MEVLLRREVEDVLVRLKLRGRWDVEDGGQGGGREEDVRPCCGEGVEVVVQERCECLVICQLPSLKEWRGKGGIGS